MRLGVRQVSKWIALACASVGMLSAQGTINYASIAGRVTDASDAVVEGAQVTARQIETNLTSSTATDHEGRFRIPYLRAGQYELKVHRQGFADATRPLTLTVGAAFDVPVSLVVESAETNVTVSGEAAVLEAARSQIAGTVSQSEVSSLPL